ncbi:MAG: THUMP domain-containing protein [Deinococcales bacterium]
MLEEGLSERGLERRLKRHVYKATHSFLAICPIGLEDLLFTELMALKSYSPIEKLEKITGGVSFEGPLDLIYLSNLHLRSAHRILLRVGECLAQNSPMLFEKVRKMPWEHYLGFAESFSLRVSSKLSYLFYEDALSNTVYKAILARLKPLGLEPKLAKGDIEVYLRLFQDRATLSINSSGEHLHKRGYRTHIGEAPLRETLAASMLMRSNYQNYDAILDPMCGSGTLLIEAALMSSRRAAGQFRPFAFEKLALFQEHLWRRAKEAAKAQEISSPTSFWGSDNDPKMIEAAKYNSTQAGLEGVINFQREDALKLDFNPFKDKKLLLISNPPYGARLQEAAPRLYQKLIHALPEGINISLLCPEPVWLKGLGSKLQIRDVQAFDNTSLKLYLIQGRIGYDQNQF